MISHQTRFVHWLSSSFDFASLIRFDRDTSKNAGHDLISSDDAESFLLQDQGLMTTQREFIGLEVEVNIITDGLGAINKELDSVKAVGQVNKHQSTVEEST